MITFVPIKPRLILFFIMIVLSACNSSTATETDFGSNPSTTNTLAADSTSLVWTGDPILTWADLNRKVNSIAVSEFSKTNGKWFGLLAKPELSLYEFNGFSWDEVSDVDLRTADPMGAAGKESGKFDYDIKIQSVDLTGDSSVEFVVRFQIAGWDRLRAPNQGQDFGVVISCDGGRCRLLPFVESTSFGAEGQEHINVETIEFVGGQLIASRAQSCGSACGTFVYSWDPKIKRFEGRPATETEKSEFAGPPCRDFNKFAGIPLQLCDAGQAVVKSQDLLRRVGFDIKSDGVFGLDMKLATQLFQKAQDIAATGVINAVTWKCLVQQSDPSNEVLDSGGNSNSKDASCADEFYSTSTTLARSKTITPQTNHESPSATNSAPVIGSPSGGYSSNRKATSIFCQEGSSWFFCTVYYDDGSNSRPSGVVSGKVVTSYRYWGWGKWTCIQLYETGGVKEIFC